VGGSSSIALRSSVSALSNRRAASVSAKDKVAKMRRRSDMEDVDDAAMRALPVRGLTARRARIGDVDEYCSRSRSWDASTPASSTSSTRKSVVPAMSARTSTAGAKTCLYESSAGSTSVLANVLSALARQPRASSMEVEENGRVEARFTSRTLLQSPQK
jgi:hypothetical protein